MLTKTRMIGASFAGLAAMGALAVWALGRIPARPGDDTRSECPATHLQHPRSGEPDVHAELALDKGLLLKGQVTVWGSFYPAGRYYPDTSAVSAGQTGISFKLRFRDAQSAESANQLKARVRVVGDWEVAVDAPNELRLVVTDIREHAESCPDSPDNDFFSYQDVKGEVVLRGRMDPPERLPNRSWLTVILSTRVRALGRLLIAFEPEPPWTMSGGGTRCAAIEKGHVELVKRTVALDGQDVLVRATVKMHRPYSCRNECLAFTVQDIRKAE